MIEKTIETIRSAEKEAARLKRDAYKTASKMKSDAFEKSAEELERQASELEKTRAKIIDEYRTKAEYEAKDLKAESLEKTEVSDHFKKRAEEIASSIAGDFLKT